MSKKRIYRSNDGWKDVQEAGRRRHGKNGRPKACKMKDGKRTDKRKQGRVEGRTDKSRTGRDKKKRT